MNKVILFGNLGQDPELRTTNSGISVCSLRLATNRRVKRGDNWEDESEWHTVVLWDAKAEAVNEHCRKGDKLLIEGEIKTRKWEDKDGNDRYSTEIHAYTFEFGGAKAGGNRRSNHEGDDDRDEDDNRSRGGGRSQDRGGQRRGGGQGRRSSGGGGGSRRSGRGL